jgi:phospholipase D-like protein
MGRSRKKKRRKKQRWSDLPPERRAAVVGIGFVQVSLLVAALADLRRRPRSEINGSKPVWVAVSFLNTIGPLAYFAFGRRRATAAPQ